MIYRPWLRSTKTRVLLAASLLFVSVGQAPVLARDPIGAAPTTAGTPATVPGGVVPSGPVPGEGPPVGPDGLPAVACERAPDRLLVHFARGTTSRNRTNVSARIAGKRLKAFGIVPDLEVVRTSMTVDRARAVLKTQTGVVSVEPDCIVRIEQTPDDPDFNQSWALRNTGQTGGTVGADIQASGAWDVRTDASDLVVAVIDTGQQLDHPDLAANLWTNPGEVGGNEIDDDSNGYIDDVHGWDFANGDPDPSDDNGHGTHVAGTIGARGNNGIGVTGVAWSVQLMPLKAFGANGSGSVSSIIWALDYAVANGARISNNSYGGQEFYRSVYDAFVAAGLANHLAIAAAGNTGVNADESPHYPAAFRLDTIVSVAATTDADALAPFSNYGVRNVQIAAPGAAIYSTLPGSAYGLLSGTSMATPHVTGVAALVAAEHPTWSPSEIRNRLLGTTRAVPGLSGKVWTGGVVDAAAALSNVATVLPPPLPAPTAQVLSTEVETDPTPAPVAAPTAPTFPTPEVLESSPMDAGPVRIALDAAGNPYVAFTQRGDGVHLLSLAGGAWVDRQLTDVYDEMYWLDLAVDPGGTPAVAVQRSWSAIESFSDPGIVVVRDELSGPAATRLTASCPDADSCKEDWTPSMAFDGSGAAHVTFSRFDQWLQDFVAAPAVSAPPVGGTGVYYADDASGGWAVRRLTTDIPSSPASIAVETDGTAHIVVGRRLGSASGMYYMTNDGGSWSSLQLTDHVEDRNSAIAVDGLGNVHVAFTRPGFGLFYLHHPAAGAWAAPALVFDGNAADIDLDVDAAGNAHVAFGVVDGWNTADGVRYATNAGGAWVVASIEGGQAHRPSIAVDEAGHAFIAYGQATGALLGIHYATNVSGSFVTSLARARSMGGGHGSTAYAVDAAGHGHVALASHYGEIDAGVFYGTDASGSWVFNRIPSSWPGSVALALDAEGRPRVAFTQQQDIATNSNLPESQQRVAYATNTTGTWQVERVSPAADFSQDGIAIAMDAADQPVIVYPTAPQDGLVRARRQAGAWTIDTIHGGDSSIRQPRMLIDPTGELHLAIAAETSGESGTRIVYVHGSTGSWSSSDATTRDSYRLYPSIARASDGTIWIADWQTDHGIQAHRLTAGGGWDTTVVTDSPFDTGPTIAVAADDSVHVVYGRGVFYQGSGCAIPVCDAGPGLRHAIYTDGEWPTTKLSPYWQDYAPLLAVGGDGSISVAFSRAAIGMRAIELVPGKPSASIGLQAASDSGSNPTDRVTNAASLTFAVAFNRAVSGLSAADFTVGGSANGCLLAAPSGSSASYEVSITGCGEGSVILTLAADAVIDDAAGTGPRIPIAAGAVTIDRTGPEVTIESPASPTSSETLGYALTFSENPDGLTAADFVVDGSALGCLVQDPVGSGADATVSVAGCGEGSVGLTLASGSVSDAAGNAGPSGDAVAGVVDVDRSGLTAALVCVPGAGVTKATVVACSATFSEAPGAVSSFGSGDVLIGGSAGGMTASTPVGSGIGPYTFNVAGSGSGGTLTIAVAAGAITDGAGNPTTASGTIALVIDRTAPTVTAPVLSIRTGTTLSGSSIRVRLAWTGADAGSGVARYELSRSTNGGSTWTSVSTSIATAGTDQTLFSSGTVRYRTRAVDLAGNVSAWATGPTVTPRLIQPSSATVAFARTWTTSSSSSYSGGSVRAATTAGASASYTFTGRSIGLVTTRSTSRGSVRIYVNGVYQATVSLYGATSFRYVPWQKTWTTSATRTIKLVVVGTPGRPRFDLDAFIVAK